MNFPCFQSWMETALVTKCLVTASRHGLRFGLKKAGVTDSELLSILLDKVELIQEKVEGIERNVQRYVEMPIKR